MVKYIKAGSQMATTVLRTVASAIAGGTASLLGGGKFANGAFSGAFVYLFNHEWIVSVSISGGVGGGGTLEEGYSLIHDSNQPWYKGWHFVRFTTVGHGTYLDASASGEINFGWSNANSVSDIEGVSTTVGFSGNTTVLPVNVSAGYEASTSGNIILHNVSIGVDTPGGSASEFHAYQTTTFVYE